MTADLTDEEERKRIDSLPSLMDRHEARIQYFLARSKNKEPTDDR
jgi:hypothetical protein